MNNKELYKELNFPEGLVAQLNDYENHRSKVISSELKERLFNREKWDEAVKELQTFLGDDSYHINILWEQLNFVSSYTYDEYVKKGISIEIFKATFGFITRFVNGTKDKDGKYHYEWAWWFQRQVTLQEFRIDSLEFEYIEAWGKKSIEIHIPSDADMKIEVLKASIRKFLEFTKTYYPDWQNVEICTDTWMIMPELEELLPVDSKILAFKHLFDIDHVDYEQSWWMGWIYPGYSEINESLPERTTLHRNLKAHLLSGKKFGIAKGHVVLERVFE